MIPSILNQYEMGARYEFLFMRWVLVSAVKGVERIASKRAESNGFHYLLVGERRQEER